MRRNRDPRVCRLPGFEPAVRTLEIYRLRNDDSSHIVIPAGGMFGWGRVRSHGSGQLLCWLVGTDDGLFPVEGVCTKQRCEASSSAGAIEAATSALSLWLKKEPRSASAQYWKARLAIAMRRPDEASAGLKEAEALGYDSRRLRVLRAISSALAAPSPQAEPLLREAFEERGEPDPLLDEALAKLYLESYDLTRAEDRAQTVDERCARRGQTLSLASADRLASGTARKRLERLSPGPEARRALGPRAAGAGRRAASGPPRRGSRPGNRHLPGPEPR